MLQLAGPSKVLRAINNRWLLIGSLLLFALLLNREGDRFPAGNEFVYLLYFWKAWHPFLPTDWTFVEPTAGHAIFSKSLGWLAVLMPLSTAAWLGRFVCWIATFLGLFRVGRHFKIPPWAVWVGIILWMLQRQSPVTGEWMIGTFEAKVIAYPCLLFAIDAVLTDRPLLAGVLCGIAFSYHSAVGMWGGAALGLVVLVTKPILKTIIFSIATIIFSLPGLITSWQLIFGSHRISPAEAKYLTTVALPDCFDASTFPHTWMVVLAILPFFSWASVYWRRDDRQIRQLFIFEIALAIFFAFGVFSRAIGRFDWVELFPMRVYAVFALLLFFWQMMSVALSFAKPDGAPRWIWIFAALMFLSMPSPLLCLRDLVATHFPKLAPPNRVFQNADRGDDADFIVAAQWIAKSTPPDDVVIAPPWFNQAFYYIRRPLIANWHAPRYDQLTEWKNRIESLVGDTSHLDPDLAIYGEMDPAAWKHYANLSPQFIGQLPPDYGHPRWLLTTGHYDYPVAFNQGTYFVYSLP